MTDDLFIALSLKYCLSDLVTLIETGPLQSSDRLSKVGTHMLLQSGYAKRIVVACDDQYIAATMAGAALYKKIYKVSNLTDGKAAREKMEQASLIKRA